MLCNRQRLHVINATCALQGLLDAGNAVRLRARPLLSLASCMRVCRVLHGSCAVCVQVKAPLPVGADAQGRPTTVLANTYAWKRLAPEADPSKYKSDAAVAQFERGDGGLLGVSCFITDGTLAPPVDALTFSTTTAPPQARRPPPACWDALARLRRHECMRQRV